MNEETRAARDRIQAFLDAHGSVDDAMISLVGLGPDGSTVELRRSDLRLVLAALDQQPMAFVTAPADITDEQLAAFRETWDEARLGPVEIRRQPEARSSDV